MIDPEYQEAIKTLPLNEKVKAVALSYYLKKWAASDQELQKRIQELHHQHLLNVLPLQREVNAIVQGLRAPTNEELKELDGYLEESEKLQKQAAINQEPLENYWLKVFANSSLIGRLLGEHDPEIFSTLESLDAEIGENGKDFKLKFQFGENNYFENKLLVKEYIFGEEDEQYPIRTKGSKINWKEGKCITKKISKKKQRNKKTGATRVVEKEVKAATFFHFFDEMEGENFQDDPENAERFEFDFEIGNTIMNQILPDALGYYLGINEDDDPESNGDYPEGEDEEDDDEDDQ